MAQLDASLATLPLTGAASARTPEERARFMAAGEDAINQRVLGGMIHADKAEATRQAFVGRIDQAGILQAINQNLSAALAALADPQKFPNLDPVQRERLFGTAIFMRLTPAWRRRSGPSGGRRNTLAGCPPADRARPYACIALAEQGAPMPTVEDVARQRDFQPGRDSALLRAIRGTGVERRPWCHGGPGCRRSTGSTPTSSTPAPPG